ncbi:uncharacterized protein LOC122245733 [Penaeus japonicus]|uniref:uncharacterized protein LOC122245733 n=1 Tax=Penaeus japonicus TaxID=27405 RepID=UPI001C71433B|nr:uncharacterized protein LOC122245733 [Penaeus japonicus]
MRWCLALLLLGLAYVAQCNVYDFPEEEQIEKLESLLLKLMAHRPRPVIQVNEQLHIRASKCCNAVPMMDCCSPSDCCALGMDCCK